MEIPVIIEPAVGGGYRVIGAGGLSLGLSAQGATAAEAVHRLSEQIQMSLEGGAKLTELTIEVESAPWKKDAGYLRDEPLYEPWRAAMREYRLRLDEDPEAL